VGSEEERRLHNDARRFARLLVSEIKLYNEQKVADGRTEGDLYQRLREYIEAQLLSGQRAIEIRANDLDRRLEDLNRLRQEVITDRERFLPRDVYDEGHRALILKIETLQNTASDQREAMRIDYQRQLDELKRRFAMLAGVALVMVPLAGVIGAAIAKGFGL